MTAYDLTLYLHIAIIVPAFILSAFLFSEAFLNWRAQVARGSNGARHRVAENAVVCAAGLVSALLYMAIRSLITLFISGEDYRDTGLVLFRLYAIATSIFLLMVTLRSVHLIKEVVIILDNVATDEGLDLPSLDPLPKATINSLPIKRGPGNETPPIPVVTAPVAVILPSDTTPPSTTDTGVPVVVAPVIVVAAPPDSVMGRAGKL